MTSTLQKDNKDSTQIGTGIRPGFVEHLEMGHFFSDCFFFGIHAQFWKG